MRYISILCMGIFLLSLGSLSPAVSAASEDDCAIWLCLPAGFAVGCGSAYKAFLRRIRNRKPPLPSLSSCVAGPGYKKMSGRYQLGRERYEPCQEGYVLKGEHDYRMGAMAQCVSSVCASSRYYYRQRNPYCQSYDAVRRAKPAFVKMWVNGDYLGQFFY